MKSLFNSKVSGLAAFGTVVGTGALPKKGPLGALMSLPRHLKGLPVSPLAVLKQARSYLGMRNEEIKIGIFIDPRISDEFLDALITEFKPQGEKSRVLVHVLSDDMMLGEKLSYDAMIFALRSPDVAAHIADQSNSRELPTLVVVEEALRQEAAEFYEMSILDIASARNLDIVMTQIADWFARVLGPHRLSLATDFEFMRPALSRTLIADTARQNALIATVFFLPGADLPAMTLNQVKMVIQLALINGEEFTLRRIVEAAFVVFSAYASRALARYMVRGTNLPLRWAAKISVAYAFTFALGKAMELWLQSAPSVPALDKSVPELLEKTPLAKLLPASEDAAKF